MDASAANLKIIERWRKASWRLKHGAAGQDVDPRPKPVDWWSAEIPTRHASMERIIGQGTEWLPTLWLDRGASALRPIARISEDQGARAVSLGTGFLLSTRLLLTTNTVIPSREIAQLSTIDFGLDYSQDGRPLSPSSYELDADSFYVTDEALDFSLIAVAPDGDGRLAGDRFGWCRIQSFLEESEYLNLAGHPGGRYKEIFVRAQLKSRVDEFIQYSPWPSDFTDDTGSVGVPIFSDYWEVVGLHHTGVPNTDSEGRFLRKDGEIWRPIDGAPSIDWVAGEGVFVDSILRHLDTLEMDPGQRQVLEEMREEQTAETKDRDDSGAHTPTSGEALFHSASNIEEGTGEGPFLSDRMVGTAQTTRPDDERGAIFLEFIVRQLADETARRAAIGGRGSSLISTSAALVTLMLAVGALVTGRQGYLAPRVVLWALVVVLACLTCAALCGLMSIPPRPTLVVSTSQLQEWLSKDSFWMSDASEVRRLLAAADIRSLEEMRRGNSSRANWATMGAKAQLGALLFLTVAVAAILIHELLPGHAGWWNILQPPTT